MTAVFRIHRLMRGTLTGIFGFFAFAAVSTVHIQQVQASDVAPPGQEIAAAVDLIKDGETKKGFDTFMGLAKQGNPHAMYHLGAIYHSGMLGEPELSKAPWYQQAADAGVLEAQFALGSLYYKGKGVPKDLGQALHCFSSAAEAGLLAAQYNLAMMHTAGLAHSKEYNADEDRQRAYKWFTVVLARIDPQADTSQILDALKLLGEEMTTIEVDQGKKMAEEWLAKNPEVSK
jgi:TPR repeat protein